MSSPATTARSTLMSILETEFGSDNFAVRADRLDNSLGFDGAVIGVSPVREVVNATNRTELQTTLQVQLFGAWSQETDPYEIVDPTAVEGWADRLRRAIGAYQQTGTTDVWWFQLDRIEYSDDPTGNCTRFTATIMARGQNPAA